MTVVFLFLLLVLVAINGLFVAADVAMLIAGRQTKPK